MIRSSENFLVQKIQLLGTNLCCIEFDFNFVFRENDELVEILSRDALGLNVNQRIVWYSPQERISKHSIYTELQQGNVLQNAKQNISVLTSTFRRKIPQPSNENWISFVIKQLNINTVAELNPFGSTHKTCSLVETVIMKCRETANTNH